MSQKIVSDSTCLIGLERIGHLEILPSLFTSPILILPAVQMEFGVMLPWLKVEPIADMGLTTVTKNQEISPQILTFLPFLRISVEILRPQKNNCYKHSLTV